MAVAGAVAIGLLISLALYYFIKELKNINLSQRIVGIVFILLALYSCSLYFTDQSSWICVLIGVIAGLILRVYFVRTRLHTLFLNAFSNNAECIEEEDFMNTKKGKIVTVLVIGLVIYAIISTACIYKLNQKINSMVVITDELREEMTR